MELLPLTLKDSVLVKRYLEKKPHLLSNYAFAGILIWKPHFDIFKKVINKKLCLFYKNPIGCFMAVPPLGGLDVKTVAACFEIMEGFNHNKEVSRIENIEEPDLVFFRKNNFRIFEKAKEYVVSSRAMAELCGEKLKHKRHSVNFFKKNYLFRVRDYTDKDKEGVLELYRRWMRERKSRNNDVIYRAMLEDSSRVLAEELKNFKKYAFWGKVVVCDREIRAFTSGFVLSKKMFCVNFEIADLSYKGIAAFIFSEFAKALCPRYPEINMMDDSGIENIRATKLAYHPTRSVTSYTALLS
jgi:hypothetical protein